MIRFVILFLHLSLTHVSVNAQYSYQEVTFLPKDISWYKWNTHPTEDNNRNLPIPSFSIPDTVCMNEPITIVNNITNASSYYWNFCGGDVQSSPTGTNIGNPGNNLQTPVFMDYVFENGRYYGFAINHNPGGLIKLDFGNSLLNQPTSTNMGNFGGIIPNSGEGIQIVKNEGRWYAIITAGFEGIGIAPRILKIDFGSNLNNPNPVATNWGNIGNLSQPLDLVLFQHNGNWHGLTINGENNTITRFDFTNSFNNTPTAINMGNIGGLQYPAGSYAINDDGQWKVFILNAGSNNVSGPDNYSLTRLDFGDNLTTTPTGVNLGNLGGTLQHPRDITIIKTCEQAVGYVINGRNGYNSLLKLDFNNDLNSIPVITDIGNTGNLNFPHSISKIFRAGDDLYSFITNAYNNSITRLRFPGCNNASISSTNAITPPSFTYNEPGSYNISLTIDDGLPTQTTICKPIVVIAAPTIESITKDTTICRNTSLQLQVQSSASNYIWTNSNTLHNNNTSTPIASPLEVTKYIVTASNTARCFAKDSVTISIRPDPIFTINPPQTICERDSIQLNAGGGNSYTWTANNNLSDISSPSPIAFPNTTTIYSVLIKDTVCQQQQTTLHTTVTVNPLPVITVAKDRDLDCTFNTAQLNASGALSYSWSPAIGLSRNIGPNPTASPTVPTEYTVTGYNRFGCHDTATVQVNITNDNLSDYLVPNAFTPNNDGKNDCFRIKFWGVVQQVELSIFNRWGELVFHSTDYNACWDGRFKNIEQPAGVYVYMVNAATFCGTVSRKGSFVLIR